MSGWLLIVALLVLGGVLSTLGDRLGSRVGKARLSLMGMRPRRTAVLITVLTGSLISALSLGFMLLVSERLRVGLFQLDQLQDRLQQSRQALTRNSRELKTLEAERNLAQQRAQRLRRELAPLQAQKLRLEQEQARLSRDVVQRDREIRRNQAELAHVRQQIASRSAELKGLEANLIALRRGDVITSTGKGTADQQASLEGSVAVSVVEVLANGNLVLRGEKQVLGFPDLRPNRVVVQQGEVLASTTIEGELIDAPAIARRLNLLLAQAYARAQRQGTLVDGLGFDPPKLNQLVQELSQRPRGQVAQLEAVALNTAETPDPIAVDLRWINQSWPAPAGRRP